MGLLDVRAGVLDSGCEDVLCLVLIRYCIYHISNIKHESIELFFCLGPTAKCILLHDRDPFNSRDLINLIKSMMGYGLFT